jgi:hypothetical protein
LKFKFLITLLFISILQPTANAATVVDAPAKVNLPYTGNEQVSDLLLTPTAISIIGTTEAATSSWIAGNLGGKSDGFISTFSNAGIPLWNLRLGGLNSEIATSAALDSDGSIWIVGASAQAVNATPSPTPTKILNPDNVIIESVPGAATSLNRLNIWQVSATGQLLNSFETQTASVVNPQKLIVTSNGLAIFGDLYEKVAVKGFFVSVSKAGLFTTPVKYGVKSTQLSSAILNSDGSFTAVGRSSDLLLKVKALSKGDAISLRISSKGALQQVGRATLKSTTRSWDSISTGLLQGGLVKYSNKTEAAVTKFSAIGKPTWNARYISKSGALVASRTNSWATFVSSGAISGLSAWKPKTPTTVVLQLGKKGEVVTAYSLTGAPVAIGRNNEIGTVVITDSGTSFGLVLIN